LTTVRLFRHHIRIPFIILGLVEAVFIAASVYGGVYLRFGQNYINQPGMIGKWELLFDAIVFSSVLVISMIAVGLYQARLREGKNGFFLRLSISFILGTIALAVIYYVFPILFMGRGIVGYSLALSFLSVLVIRTIAYRLNPESFKRRVLVIGTGKSACAITELRRKSDKFGFILMGFVHLRGEHDEIEPSRIVRTDQPLDKFVTTHGVDEIIVAIDDRRKGFPIDELLNCKMIGVNIIDVLGFFERETGKVRLDQLTPGWFIFSDGFVQSATRLYLKRGFDIIVSTLILLATLPFTLATVFTIKLENGPGAKIFYRQVRVGENGKPYHVFKFRSMQEGAEKGGVAQWATKNDSRVTRVGKIIRKTRIDEIPQIYNVLRGDMSFVGPRPERPQFVVKLSEEIPYYDERHRVKPGITGWAQLLYPYGSSEKDAFEKLQYDLYYIKNNSLLLDLLIIIQTVEVVLFGKGAR
jgi:sugar transferase (PEP-CTERM system associated)